MQEMVVLANDLLDSIDRMIEPLYQEKEEEGVALLNVVIGKIETMIGYIVAYQTKNAVKLVDENKLLGTVGEAFQALQNKDIVLLADIFNYDVRKQIEQIL